VLLVEREQLVHRLLRRAKIQHRTDDTEDVIRRRLQVYADQTVPLISLYTGRDLVREVDGNGAIEEVREYVLQVVSALTPAE
jgi:adenylate kinase